MATRLVAKHGQPVPLPGAKLRDRLIEGLLPGPLRRHLRRRAAEDAAMTFHAARDEALRFEREEAEDAPAVARVCEQREQPAADLDDRVAALTDAVAKLAGLIQSLQQQRQQQPTQQEVALSPQGALCCRISGQRRPLPVVTRWDAGRLQVQASERALWQRAQPRGCVD